MTEQAGNTRRLPRTAWQPGVSGNPGGRPRDEYHLRELARQYTPQAIATIVQVMGDAHAPPRARLAAAEILLDRGYGRPIQTVRGDPDHPVVVRDARRELEDMLARIVVAARERDGRATVQ